MARSLFIGGGKVIILSPKMTEMVRLSSFKNKYRNTDDVILDVLDIPEWRKKEKKVPPILEDYDGSAFLIRVDKFLELTRKNVIRVFDDIGDFFDESIDGRSFSTDALFVGKSPPKIARRVVPFLKS